MFFDPAFFDPAFFDAGGKVIKRPRQRGTDYQRIDYYPARPAGRNPSR